MAMPLGHRSFNRIHSCGIQVAEGLRFGNGSTSRHRFAVGQASRLSLILRQKVFENGDRRDACPTLRPAVRGQAHFGDVGLLQGVEDADDTLIVDIRSAFDDD